MPLSRRNFAVPNIVCSASNRATAGLSPSATPPSIIASSIYAKYAGPDPESAVTASKSFSFSTTVAPAPPRIASTAFTSFAGAFGPGQIAHMPAFARSARLGITRMSRTFVPNAARSFASVLPATMETIVFFAVRRGFTSAATVATSCGRTARKMRSADLTTALRSSVVFTPYLLFSSAARSATFSAMMTSFLAGIAERIPSAILPAPKNPIFICFLLSSKSESPRSRGTCQTSPSLASSCLWQVFEFLRF